MTEQEIITLARLINGNTQYSNGEVINKQTLVEGLRSKLVPCELQNEFVLACNGKLHKLFVFDFS